MLVQKKEKAVENKKQVISQKMFIHAPLACKLQCSCIRFYYKTRHY
jgi:hypothetical protein